MALPSIAMTRGDQPSVLAQLIELRDKEVEAARHLFVVCGQPSTDEGLYDAWCKEDPEWFRQVLDLGLCIRRMQK